MSEKLREILSDAVSYGMVSTDLTDEVFCESHYIHMDPELKQENYKSWLIKVSILLNAEHCDYASSLQGFLGYDVSGDDLWQRFDDLPWQDAEEILRSIQKNI